LARFDGPVARILKQILFDPSLLVVNDEVEPPAFGVTVFSSVGRAWLSPAIKRAATTHIAHHTL